MLKKILFKTFLITLICCSPSFLFAAKSRLSIDTTLQNLYSQVRHRDEFKDLPDTMHNGDIFAQAYKVAKHGNIEHTIKFLEYTTSYLNTIYTQKCEMTQAEVGILLYQHEDIRKDINSLIKLPSPDNIDTFYDVFYSACEKLNRCTKPDAKNYKTDIMLQSCVEDATTAYLLSQKSNINTDDLQKDLVGENLLIDGNPDNGPFDLLVDIKYIGDILFKDNVTQPESVFFELPEVEANNSDDNEEGDETSLGEGNNIASRDEPEGEGDILDPKQPGGEENAGEQSPGDPPGKAIGNFINKNNTDKTSTSSSSSTLDIGDPCAPPPPQQPAQPGGDQKLEQLEQIYQNLLDEYDDLTQGLDSPLSAEDTTTISSPQEPYVPGSTSMGSPNFPMIKNQLECSALCSDMELARSYQSMLREGKKQINELYRTISTLDTSQQLEDLRDQLLEYLRTLIGTIATMSFDDLNTKEMFSKLANISGNVEEISQQLYDQQDRIQYGVNDLSERISDIAKENVKTGQIQQEICEANCCLQTCKHNFKGSDKLICMSQCLCGEISGPQKPLDFAGERSPTIEYKVRFCRIPVETVPIIPKGIQSIEEILDEINNILTQLKESGQLMKHNKTKEMMETRLKTINLGDMFAFNMFVKFKPIFDVIPEHEIKQKKTDLHETWKQQFREVYGDLGVQQERNKYLIMHDTTWTNANKNIATDYVMSLENLRDQQDIVEQAKISNDHLLQGPVENTLRSKYYDEVANFVRDNARFWEAVTESVNLFNDTAGALNMKIKNSP